MSEMAERVFLALTERPLHLTTISHRCGIDREVTARVINELANAGKIVFIGYRWRPRVLALASESRREK